MCNYHRRSGKDEIFLHHTACAAFERVGNYWYLLPKYSQARKSMWEAINPHTGKRRIDEAFPQEIRTSTREDEMVIKLKSGSTFQLIGSDNFDSLVGSPPLGMTFSEYALSNPRAWGYLRPILLENKGWAGFNSTPRGKNHFFDLCKMAEKEEGWFYEQLTASQTGVFTETQLADELRQMQAEHGDEFGHSLWLQEYFSSFDAAIMGSIWGDCVTKARDEKRIRGDQPLAPGVPVSTAWDLGFSDDTAIWFFQVLQNELRIIDCYAASGKDIEHFADILKQKKAERSYTYETHWLPHDARPRTLAAGGKSILQQLLLLNVGQCKIVPRLDRQDGIQAARNTLPWCTFDEVRCADGIEAISHYHREWDSEKKSFRDSPEHDWSSHYADAFRYLSLTWKVPKLKQRPLSFEAIMTASVNPTFGDIKKEHFIKMRKMRGETV